MNADVKGYGVPVTSTVELEDATKPAVQPVQESTDGVSVKLNDQTQHSDTAQKEKSLMSSGEMEDAAKDIQQRFEAIGSSFRFGLFMDQKSETIVGQLRDKKTDEVVKQFPPEEVIKLRVQLKDLIGLIFDEKV
jgi:flagellar protein FlaG